VNDFLVLLLLVRHSGITSLILFARLFSLLPFPRLSLALSHDFFHMQAETWRRVWGGGDLGSRNFFSDFILWTNFHFNAPKISDDHF